MVCSDSFDVETLGFCLPCLQYETKKALIFSESNHRSRRYVAEHGIGNLKPKGDLLGIAGKEFSYQVCNVCYFAQSLRNWLGNVRVETHGRFSDLRDLS